MKYPMALLAVVLLGTGYVQACGPFFDPAYLNGEDFTYTPHVNWSVELALLGDHYFPELGGEEFLPVKSARNTVIASDIRAACEESSIDPASTALLINFFQSDSSGWEFFTERYPSLKEFVLYARGEKQLKDFGTIPSAWLELLTLPSEQRRYRTAWVWYMLGNLAIRHHLPTAQECYRHLRDEVKAGGRDSWGLAYASFYSEYEYAQVDLATKLRLLLQCYIVRARANDTVGMARLADDYRVWCRVYYPRLSPAEKKAVLADPIAGELVLLYETWRNDGHFPTAAAELMGTRKLFCADQLAWLAFRAGREDECRRYLAMAPEDSSIRLWLEAKFARHHQRYGEAAALLRRWLANVSQKHFADRVTFCDEGIKVDFASVIRGELASNTISDPRWNADGGNDFSEVLYTFMQAESWPDAATVAEQLMTLKALTAYCTVHCPKAGGGPRSDRLRYLLARRLLREYRFTEAVEWFPVEFVADAKAFIRLFRCGNDAAMPRNTRAAALYNLGKLTRQRGMQLLATELAPDYLTVDCEYDGCGLNDKWKDGNYRLQNVCRPMIYSRWHYRERAVEFWSRAALLTDQADLRAAALYLAFATLRVHHPEQADHYYKMLCDQRPHPLAERAWKDNWKFSVKDWPLAREMTNPQVLAVGDFAGLFEADGSKGKNNDKK